MECPDCNTKAMSFEEYCKKCGAELFRSDETRSPGPKNSNIEFSLNSK